MKRKWIIPVIIIAVILILAVWVASSYNGIVAAEQTVDEKAATVDTMLTRRADLIPNLVSTVKGYATHEETVFTAVADARAKLAGSQTTEDKMAANGELDSALSRLLVVVEQYPELKASTQFTSLQDQLEGAENRISTARTDYNEAVKQYNTRIRKFPTNLIASMFGFEKRTMFQATEAQQTNPTVSFE